MVLPLGIALGIEWRKRRRYAVVDHLVIRTSLLTRSIAAWRHAEERTPGVRVAKHVLRPNKEDKGVRLVEVQNEEAIVLKERSRFSILH